ncbi:MAG: META domain-containing protein [Anaerolineales bacterium]
MKPWTLVLAGLALAACSSAGESVSLEGALWALESYQNADGETVNVVPNSGARAEFENGEVSGTSGCNRFFGAYEVDGNSISIGPLGSTLMACPPPLMDQEVGFMTAIQAAEAYEISGNTLTMSNAEGEVVVTFFESEPLSLSGSDWIANGVNNGRGGVQSIVIGNEITAVFGEEGSLSGSAGCNNYSGTYEVDGENMSIGPLTATEKFCMLPEGTMDQESEYLAALQTVATWSIDGDILHLTTSGGSSAVSYIAGGPAE